VHIDAEQENSALALAHAPQARLRIPVPTADYDCFAFIAGLPLENLRRRYAPF